MKELSRKEFTMVCLMLFSFFFGAGNLIFPPMSGHMSGTSIFVVMAFFSITAVFLPILGVIAVSKTKGLSNLAKRVSPNFAVVFSILVYFCLGPFLGIPRAGSLPFEMAVLPYLPENFSVKIALLIYSLVFFIVVYFLSLNPNKLINIIGKFLTPILLILILFLFAGSIVKDVPIVSNPVGEYSVSPHLKGLLDGYNTMDAVGALNFGFVIYLTISRLGIKDDKQILKITKKAGIIAGLLLITVYFMLGIIGAKSAHLFPDATNGAVVLSSFSKYLFGNFGLVLIGLIFTIACVTISISLVTSTATFFTDLFKGRFGYKSILRILILVSFIVSNLGLDQILKYTSSLIVVVYPVSVVLILMALLNKYIKSDKLVYRSSTYVVFLIALVDGLSLLNIKIPFIYNLFMKLPLSDVGLSWVIPSIVVFIITMIISRLNTNTIEDLNLKIVKQ